MSTLSNRDYAATMDQIVEAARTLQGKPFQDLLDTISTAHSVGPIRYPNDYRRAVRSGTLDLQRRMILAAQSFTGTLTEAEEKGL